MIDMLVLTEHLVNRGVPIEDAKVLVCIAKRESNLNPHAINDTLNRNGTIDRGLFQINSANVSLCNTTENQLFDIRVNIKCAIKIYKSQGFKAWYTHKFCN